tara:strand:- start:464 stop:688 length:225 start_codon:yes stop_codon:yes gene_type:complete
MSNEKEYNFISKPYDKTMEQIDEVIESRGYKKAVKSFQNKYPKLKIVDVWWVKDGKEIYKEQKLPMGRKKKLEG